MMMRRLFTLTLAMVVLAPNFCWAWGGEGHQIIATVAEDHLDETTKVMIQSLLGNKHLYSIAAWADDIRRERPGTKAWHYVNIPQGSEYKASRDCPLPQSCVIAKIGEFVKVLTDKNASREQRAEALKFLVHFVGDLHHPLHAAMEEAGGNGVPVRFLNSNQCGHYECNLHGVWDTSMILETGLHRQEYSQRLEELIRATKLDTRTSGSAEQWANESRQLATAAWVQDGTNTDEQYERAQIKVVDRQMALAGLRLAKLLNQTIGRMTPRDFH
jgi:hypothetical protein